MLKGLLRLALLLVILVGVGGFLLGWWNTGDIRRPQRTGEEVGTTGTEMADRARDATAEVGDRAGAAASQAKIALEDGALTAKIKSKMALDDTVKALNLDVDTNGSVVTISGTVASENERTRALQLARETEGVTQVVDRIQVKR
jgi:hyperosmotically inducible protein